MRIIAGYLKGRKITLPNDKYTRPLKDLTKESIFNILQHSNLIKFTLEKSKILDMFSGVGSFGLECISRGAKKVVFLENYTEATKILKKNITDLNCESKTKIITKNIFNIKNLNLFEETKFEIIFLDPPYKEKRLNNLLDDIISLKLLKNNGIIIIHRHKKEEEIYPKNFNILKIKTYGISKIIFGN
jgi:16S rRNA (guanine966-N2)-methyltransferase